MINIPNFPRLEWLYANVKGDEFFMCANFWFSAIMYAEVRANKPFYTNKPLNYLSRWFDV